MPVQRFLPCYSMGRPVVQRVIRLSIRAEVGHPCGTYPQGGQLHEQTTWSATPHLSLTTDRTEKELKTPHPPCHSLCMHAYYTHSQSYQPHPLTITYLLFSFFVTFLVHLKMTPVRC